ncbi:MAG: HAMP domain-containing protein [Candidatus Riflebacteria bacterium]|nr:HAMP domain-containing protein [Candidatus Riflebacteria bacterium]
MLQWETTPRREGLGLSTEHHAAAAGPARPGWAGVRGLLLPLLLSLIPLVLLEGIAREQAQRAVGEQVRDWQARTEPLGIRLRREAEPEFWVARAADRLRRALSPRPGHPAAEEETLARAVRAAALPGLPAPRIWVFTCPDPSLEGPPVLLTGPGLERSLGSFFSRLFREVGRCAGRQTNDLLGPLWRNRARAFFGPGFTLSLLAPDQEGKVLSVIFQGTYALMSWGLIGPPGGLTRMFLLVQPIRATDRWQGLRFCLAGWSRRGPTPGLRPLFVDLPGLPPVRRRAWLHPDIQGGRRQEVLRFLSREMGSVPAPRSLRGGASQAPIYPDASSSWFFGHPRLLADRLDERLELAAGTWGRLVRLPPSLGTVGMLVGPAPRAPASLAAALAAVARGVWLAFWVLVLVRTWWFGDLPTPGFRVQMALWLALLAAIPCLLLLEGGERIRADLEANLLEQARQELTRVGQAIEGKWSAGLGEFAANLGALAARPGLGEEFSTMQRLDDPGTGPLAAAHRQLFPRRGDKGGVLVMGPGGFRRKVDSLGLPHELVEPMLELIGHQGEENLVRNDPALGREFPVASFSNATRALLNSLMPPHAFARVEQETQLNTLEVGDERFSVSLRRVHIGTRVRFLLGAIWDPIPSFAEDLRRTVPRLAREYGCDLAVFRAHGRLQRCLATTVAGADELARLNRIYTGTTRFLSPPGGRHLVMVSSTPALPDMTVVARLSLRAVRDRLQAERLALLALLGGILGMMAGLGWWLIRRLVRPVGAMTAGLQRIIMQDLDFRLASDRGDELGQTMRTLDAMTAWLREKVRLQDFVSPQLRKALRAGELDQAVRGSRRPVVVLVSDIREFTTISEAHPPERVFLALNRHLQAMTAAIHAHGGVVDRFIGDAIQAVFLEGTPPSPTLAALGAARAMLAAHEGIQEERRGAGVFPYRIGIGIQAGEALTGVLGDPEVRLDFSLLGDPIAEAAALEGASKKARQVPIVVSGRVRGALGEAVAAWTPVAGEPDAWEAGVTTVDPPSSGALAAAAGGGAVGSLPTTGPADQDGPGEGPFAVRETGVSHRHPWRQRGMADIVSVGSVPRTVVAGYGETRWGKWVAAVLAGGVWLGVFGLAAGGGRHLQDDWREKEILLERGRLSRDLMLAGAGLVPDAEIALDLRRSLQETRLRLPASADTTMLLAALARTLQAWQRRFPRLHWAVLEHQPYLDPQQVGPDCWAARLFAEDGPLAMREAGVSRRHPWRQRGSPSGIAAVGPLQARGVEAVISHFTGTLCRVTMGNEGDWKARVLIQAGVLAGNWDEFVRGRYARFADSALAGLGGVLFWEPFFEAGFDQSGARDRMDETDWNADLRGHWNHLLGHVVVALPQTDLTFDQGMTSLRRNFRRRGAEIFLGKGMTPTRPMSTMPPPRRRGLGGTSDRRTAGGPSPAAGGSVRGAGPGPETRLEAQGMLAGEVSRPFRIIRRLTRAAGPARLPRLLLQVVTQAWVCLTILLLAHLVIFRTVPVPSLRGQLVGGFLLLFLPASLVAVAGLGRRLQENQVRLLVEERNRLRSLVRRIDEGGELYTGWMGRCLDTLSHHPVLRQVIARVSGPARPDGAEGVSALQMALAAAFRHGVDVGGVNLFGVGDWWCSYPSLPEGQARAATFWRLLTGAMMADLEPLLPSGGGASAPRDEALLITRRYQEEELRDFLLQLAPPAYYANLMYAPRALQIQVLGARQNAIYRDHVWIQGTPRAILQANWERESEAFHLFTLWRKVGEAAGTHEARFRVSFLDRPSVFLSPPFWVIRYDGSDFKINETYAYGTPRHGELAALALAAGGTWWEVVGRGESQELRVAATGERIRNFIFQVGASLGKARTQAMAEIRGRLDFLALLVGAALVLGLGVARRVLDPLESLSEGAREVMRGNFQVRVRIDRYDEFGFLAQAFNTMVQGVQEGRLLRRFVSESVREAVRDGTRRRRSGAGERRQAVILFAGLAGFKNALATRPAESLVDDLNRYLEAMSRIVRREGGEIDKFIGDRVLAVFFPAPGESGGDRAVAGALAAARAMVRWMREREASPPDPSQAMEPATSVGGPAGLQPEKKAATVLPGPLGIGVVEGAVLSGILGVPEVRLEQTVIGDPVNLASRLCDLAGKERGGGILVDAPTRAAVEGWARGQGIALQALGEVAIKGKSLEVQVFKVV